MLNYNHKWNSMLNNTEPKKRGGGCIKLKCETFTKKSVGETNMTHLYCSRNIL